MTDDDTMIIKADKQARDALIPEWAVATGRLVWSCLKMLVHTMTRPYYTSLELSSWWAIAWWHQALFGHGFIINTLIVVGILTGATFTGWALRKLFGLPSIKR